MKLAGYPLRQRDGYSCGPTVAVVAVALLDGRYRARLDDGPDWFAAEQGVVHRQANRVWPRRLGMTPVGLAAVLTVRSPVRYRWRIHRGLLPGRQDPATDVVTAVRAGHPVAMLIGHVIPRHWVLIVAGDGNRLRCFDPASGQVRTTTVGAIRKAHVEGLGFGRPFALVLPARPGTRCAPQNVKL